MSHRPKKPFHSYYNQDQCVCLQCIRARLKNNEILRQLERENNFRSNSVEEGKSKKCRCQLISKPSTSVNCHACEGRGWVAI